MTEESFVKRKTNISDLFREAKIDGKYLNVCAPMVRYSKLEFRTLVKKYGVDLCFTPMIMADSFCRSDKARLNEFSTDYDDSPLIAQFATNSSTDFLSATEMIYPYVDGVDLNCGCPQSWAQRAGLGSALLHDPEKIADMMSTIRRTLPSTFSVSVKIRLSPHSVGATIDLCRQLQACGVTFLTLHGRTAAMKSSEPVRVDAIAEVKKSLSIPLIANGDITSIADADARFEATGCDGMMTARSILANPALFAGYDKTPLCCLQDFIDLSAKAGPNITFQCFHHHLTFMTDSLLRKKQRIHLNGLTRMEQVLGFMSENFGIVPRADITAAERPPIRYDYDETKFRERLCRDAFEGGEIVSTYCSSKTDGKYFQSIVRQAKQGQETDCDLDFMDSNMFDS